MRSRNFRRALPVIMVVVSAGTAVAQLHQGPALPPTPGAGAGAGEVEFLPGEILVKFHDEVPPHIAAGVHADLDSRVLYQSPFVGFQRVQVSPGVNEKDMVELYSSIPLVEYAELNTVCRSHGVPNDTFYNPYQWHLPQIGLETAWDDSTGTGAVIAVLDSGVAYENFTIPSYEASTVANGVTQYVQAPDLANTSFVAGYDFVNGDSHPNDNNSHGTHVAGTCAQSTNNNLGCAGVAYNASIMPVKVLDYTGSGSASALADGLYYAANNGADVVNMSLGWSPGYNPGATVANAVTYAYNAGVTLCASSGNSGTGTVSYPAAYSEVIAVGATRYDQALSYYSQYGSAQEVVAPGGDVTIDQNGDGYVDGVLQNTMVGYSSASSKADPTSFGYYFFQGTSMASPHVAGVVALMVANGITGPATIRAKLQSTATDLGASGWDSTFGYGLIDAAAAVDNGGGGGDTTAPNPDPMSFASLPASAGTSSITMMASTASDPSGVEYFFEALTAGGHDSGWQDATTYVDTGLAADTSYTYRVSARDKSTNQNQTEPSANASAFTDPDGGGGPVEISYDDFESGWGSYSDGGGDCRRYTRGTYSPQGNDSINIQDNSGTNSSFAYSSSVDLSAYSSLTVEFEFYARSMENGEDFFVEYYDGSQWNIIAAFARGTDFNNNTFYIASVGIDDASYNFASNASLRFRCDASGNRDDVYIDAIRVTAE